MENNLTLGEKLRQIREQANLSLEELAEKTLIQKKYLAQLEEDELSKMPAPVYVSAFIRKWAQACGVDAQDPLLQYQREHGLLQGALSQDRDITARTIYTEKAIITPRFIAIGAVVVVFLGILIYFGYHLIFSSPQPSLEIERPAGLGGVVTDDILMLRGSTKHVEHLTINGKEYTLEEDGSFAVRMGLEEGSNTFVIKARGANGKTVETIRQIIKIERNEE